MTRVVLVDDHALIRRGMRDALAHDNTLQVVGEAGGADALHALLAATPCDVILLDINLPGTSGLDILATLRQERHPARALMVSMYPEDQYAVKALRAGAWGYVNKSADPGVLIEAIHSVAHGRKYISPAIAALLVEQLATPQSSLPHERLSDLERQTLILIAGGLKLPEIAQRLNLAPKTVGVYRARLLEKMKLAGNTEIAHYARTHGLVQAPG